MNKILITIIISLVLVGGIAAISFNIKDDFTKKIKKIKTKDLCDEETKKGVVEKKCKADTKAEVDAGDLITKNSDGVYKIEYQ